MVNLETIAVSAVVSLVVSLVSFEYRFRRERGLKESDEVNSWYAESAQLGSSVQNTWRRKFVRPNERGTFTSFDEVQREMNLLSNQISRHADEGETLDVDDEVITTLRETANACREVYDIRIHSNSMDQFKNSGQEAVEQAAKTEEVAFKRIQ